MIRGRISFHASRIASGASCSFTCLSPGIRFYRCLPKSIKYIELNCIMGNEITMCVEPENEAAQRRFWRKEFHGNVDFSSVNASLGSDHGSFKVDKESRYERINIADIGTYADDFLPDDDEMVSNGMPDDVRNKIASLFISTFPLSMLNEQSRERILNMMKKKEVRRNEVVQAAGKKQDCFYMISDGEFEEVDTDGKVMNTYGSCLANAKLYCFGQMQLIHNVSKSKTSVKCKSVEGTLWGLDSEVYVRLLSSVSKHAGRQRLKLLKKVDFFKKCNLSRDQISHISLAMTRIKYKSGEQIIQKNEVGAEFFIVVKGQAEATNAGENDGSQLYKSGDCFGEQALINDSGVREANVKAVGKSGCEVFSLHRDDFTNLLGPYVEVMQKQHCKMVLSQILKESSISQIQRIANLGNRQLEQFMNLFETKKYENEEVIYSPETPGLTGSFYIIYKGTVIAKTLGNEKDVANTLKVKEYFGDLPFEDENNTNLKYIAQGSKEGTVCFQIGKKSFWTLWINLKSKR